MRGLRIVVGRRCLRVIGVVVMVWGWSHLSPLVLSAIFHGQG